jgi:hypothetical protein
MPLWVPALAAAAVIVIAVITNRPQAMPVVAQPIPDQIARALVVPPPVATANPVAQVATVDRPERSERSERPIVIEPLAVPLMAVDTSSGVMPIEVEPLRIEPLQPE